MRFTAAVLATLCFVAGCSDATGPEDFELQAGTYEMLLTDCSECPDGSTPTFAVVWRDGVVARVAISNVSSGSAQAEFLVLETTDDVSLRGGLASTFVDLAGAESVYEGTVGFVDGTISLSLHAEGCGFELEYPDVATGRGSCELR